MNNQQVSGFNLLLQQLAAPLPPPSKFPPYFLTHVKTISSCYCAFFFSLFPPLNIDQQALILWMNNPQYVWRLAAIIVISWQHPSLKEVGVVLKRINSTVCILVSPWRMMNNRHAWSEGCLTPDVLIRFHDSKTHLNSQITSLMWKQLVIFHR